VARRKRPLLAVGFLSLLVIVTSLCVGVWRWRVSHAVVVASSAEVVADTSTVSTEVDGAVKQVLVKSGQTVKRGQILAIIDNPELVHRYTAAENALAAAKKLDTSTQAAIIPPPIVGNIQANGPPLNLQTLKPLPQAAPGEPASPIPGQSTEAESLPNKRVAKAEANLRLAQTASAQCAQQLESSQAALEAAQSDLSSQSVPLEALKTTVELTKAKRDKFQGLYDDGIISRSEFQQKEKEYETAQSNVDDANKAIQTAQDQVNSKQSDETKAAKAAQMAQTDLANCQSLLDKTKATSPKSHAKPLPKPLISISPEIRHRQKPFVPHFGVAPPPIAPLNLQFSPDNHLQAQTQEEEAASNLKTLGEELRACQIVAPGDGTISDIKILAGQNVTAKTPILSLTKPASQRIVATFPYRQALRIHNGQKCEVAFGTLPHQMFMGRIACFLDSGNPTHDSKVEILLPDRMDVLSTMPSGTATQVRVLPG
jgi:multidrug resistance efflux pump